MSLQNFNPATGDLLPGLVQPTNEVVGERRSREGYFQHNVGATYVLTADWPEDQKRWDATSAGAFTQRTINNVEYLIDGRATFAAMLEAIETATEPEHFIILLGWGLNLGFVMVDQPSSRTSLHGKTMNDVLRSRTEMRVKVRVLLWNNKLVPTEYDEHAIRNNLIQKTVIDRLNPSAPAPEETPRRALCILDGNTRFAGAHHQKVLLVYGSEGLIGFVGGIDVAEDRVEATKARMFIGSAVAEVGAPLHDVHARVQGQAAHDLLTLAANRWNASYPVRAYATPEEVLNGTAGKALTWGEDPALPRGAPQNALPGWGWQIENLEVLVGPARTARHGVLTPHHHVRIGQTVGNPSIAQAGVQGSISDAWPMIRHCIRQAKKFIYIEDQYFWSKMAADALAAALPNIERLIILVTSDDADATSRSLRHECINQLFDKIASPADKKKVGIYNRKEAYERYIHAKMLIIDDEVAIIGSANMNNRGYTHDSEVIGVFTDPNWDDPSGPREGKWFALELNFARKLRMQLWAEHLRISAECLFDPLAAAMHWECPSANANVMPCPYQAGDSGWGDAAKNATLDPLIWDPEGL